MQANYTLVEQSGISNSNLATQGALDGGGTGGFGAGLDVSGGRGAVIDSHRLAGISKHTFNIVGLYEKGPVALRLAYNWRSQRHRPLQNGRAHVNSSHSSALCMPFSAWKKIKHITTQPIDSNNKKL